MKQMHVNRNFKLKKKSWFKVAFNQSNINRSYYKIKKLIIVQAFINIKLTKQLLINVNIQLLTIYIK